MIEEYKNWKKAIEYLREKERKGTLTENQKLDLKMADSGGYLTIILIGFVIAFAFM